ncbi:hypothetical protein [Lentzea sp. NBRC 102530]|uniref:hypothetical protein n=1 Tax=Lentzea sp. NBRC 102530 TaxID=3032201 RepID=UPI00255604B2|nr:hypothetical protein [Lentzea sp. NBRC 102530]
MITLQLFGVAKMRASLNPRQEPQRMGTGLTSGFRLDAWSCRPVSCCSARVWWCVAAVSVVPQNYVADDRRLLQAKALGFVYGFMLLPAAGPLPGAASCVHAAI